MGVSPSRCSIARGATVRRDRLVTCTTEMAGSPFWTRGGSTARSSATRGRRTTCRTEPSTRASKPAPSTAIGTQWENQPSSPSATATTAVPMPNRVTAAPQRSSVRGTGTACRARAMTSSAVRPWTSASGRRMTRWARVDWAMALTSSGVT